MIVANLWKGGWFWIIKNSDSRQIDFDVWCVVAEVIFPRKQVNLKTLAGQQLERKKQFWRIPIVMSWAALIYENIGKKWLKIEKKIFEIYISNFKLFEFASMIRRACCVF